MTEYLIPYLEQLSLLCLTWGPLLVLLFMTIESSFIPFPSEIVLLPAGFLAARHEFYPGNEIYAVLLIIVFGVAGSLLGATLNYYLSLRLGRPFLFKWGKYFFIQKKHLEKAEDVFKKYGELATFLCRLIPVVRQLISIPAGVLKMIYYRFAIYTCSGAGIWVAFLTFAGYKIGASSKHLDYNDLVTKGEQLILSNSGLIILVCLLFVVLYWLFHRKLLAKL